MLRSLSLDPHRSFCCWYSHCHRRSHPHLLRLCCFVSGLVLFVATTTTSSTTTTRMIRATTLLSKTQKGSPTTLFGVVFRTATTASRSSGSSSGSSSSSRCGWVEAFSPAWTRIGGSKQQSGSPLPFSFCMATTAMGQCHRRRGLATTTPARSSSSKSRLHQRSPASQGSSTRSSNSQPRRGKSRAFERPNQQQQQKQKWNSPSTAGSRIPTTTALRLTNPQISSFSDNNNNNQTPSPRSHAPRLYRRSLLLRGSKRDTDASSEGYFRADRVVANRTGKSRKECFRLLQEGRVFEVVVVVGDNNDQGFPLPQPKQNAASPRETTPTDISSHADGALQQSQQQQKDTNNVPDLPPSIPNAGADRSLIHSTNDTRTRVGSASPQQRLVPIQGPSAKISMRTELRIDKHQVVPLPPPLLAVYYKPKWVLSVRNDPLGRPCLDTLFDGTVNDFAAPATFPQSMHPVGRLDYDTTGLLLFSSSGPLTQALLHPKHAIEKEYIATVAGVVQEEELRATLQKGVTTGEGVHTAQLLSVTVMPEPDVASYLQSIQSEFPTSYNKTDLKIRGYLDVFDASALSIVALTVAEGKHRMVRRMLANVGHPVVSLHRVRIGAIRLDDGEDNGNTALLPGKSRSLTADELKWAQRQRPQRNGASVVQLLEEPDTELENHQQLDNQQQLQP